MIDFRGIEAKRTIENLKRHRTWPILLGIFFVGFSIRYLTHHNLLFDPDSYWWYRLSEYFSGIKTAHVIEEGGVLKDQLAYYPTGRDIHGELLGLPLVIGYSYKILSSLGVIGDLGLMEYMFIIGPVFGGLTAVAAFFLIKELINIRVAAFSALFYSFISSAMTRNTAGDTGQESLGGLLIFLWLYLFIRASKEETLSRRHLAFSLTCGLFFALAHITWGGNLFYFGLIVTAVLFFVVYTALSKGNYSELESISATFAIAMPAGIFLSSILGPYPLFINSPIYYLAYFTIFSCIVFVSSLRFKKMREIGPLRSFAGAVAFVLLITLALGVLPTIIGPISSFVRALMTGGQKGFTGNTVAYYRSSSMADFKSAYGLLLAFIPFGILYLFYEFYKIREFKPVFIAIWLILGIIAFKWMIRLSYFLALILPVVAVILVDAAFKYRGNAGEAKIKRKSKKLKASSKSTGSSSRFASLVMGAIVVFLVVPHLNSGITFTSSAKFNDGSVVPWKDVGEWIKSNTPEDALMFHWWDYGYHLQTFAERRTMVDGGNSGKPLTDFGNRNIDVAKAFTSTEEQFYDYIKPYNPEDRPIYALVSYAEFGKSGAINYHADGKLFITSFSVPKTGNLEQDQKTLIEILQRNRISTYYIANFGNSFLVWALIQVDEKGEFHPDWSEKLLAKLLPFNTGYGQGLKHFQLVYNNGYVYVYKYIP